MVHYIRYHLIISSSILIFNIIQLNVTYKVQKYKWDNLTLNSIGNLCATIIYVIQNIYVPNKFIGKLLLYLKSYYCGSC